MTETEPGDTMGGEWAASWKNRSAVVTVIGGVLGDWGDDARVRSTTVRSHAASYVADDGTVTVTWTEPAACAPSGEVGYRLDSRGLSTAETLRVAQALRDA